MNRKTTSPIRLQFKMGELDMKKEHSSQLSLGSTQKSTGGAQIVWENGSRNDVSKMLFLSLNEYNLS